MNLHKLLQRQLKTIKNEELLQKEEFQQFISLINQSYVDFEDDKSLLSNINIENQKELSGLNEQLQNIAKSQELIIEEQTKNITEAYGMLSKSESEFKALLENLAEVIIITNSDCTITYVSPNIESLLGYKPQEVIFKEISSLFPLHKRQEQKKRICDIPNLPYKQGIIAIELLDAHQTEISFDFFYKNEMGNPLFNSIIFTLRNTSEVKSKEMEIVRQKDFYEHILQEIPADIAIFDETHRYIYLNKKSIKNDELRKYIIGKTDLEYAAYRGRDVTMAKERMDLFKRVKESKIMHSFEEELTDAEGNKKTMIRNFHPVFDEHNNFRYVVGFGLDITERKEAERKVLRNEEKLNLIMNSALDAIIILDSKGIVTFVNPSAEQIFGWPKEEMLNKSLAATIIPNEHREGHQHGMQERMKHPEKKSEILKRIVELPAMKKNGERIKTELTIFPIDIENERIFCSFIRDISDRKRAEEEILNLNTTLEDRVVERTLQLENANKELDSFSYSVSHDLRSPLRAVDGWSQALLEDYGNVLDETAHEYISRIKKESNRMSDLIDNLLSLSKISKIRLNVKPVHLTNLSKEVFERIIEQTHSKNIKFTVEENLKIEADPSMMDIVLTNLISNAVKFTQKKDAPEIIIGQTIKEEMPVFYIKDNGAGFNLTASSKLFGAFQRMHKQSDFPGTGIGLATVQKIINAHGGRIWAESEKDAGATFYFYVKS